LPLPAMSIPCTRFTSGPVHAMPPARRAITWVREPDRLA
jgi:hypothetical protein